MPRCHGGVLDTDQPPWDVWLLLGDASSVLILSCSCACSRTVFWAFVLYVSHCMIHWGLKTMSWALEIGSTMEVSVLWGFFRNAMERQRTFTLAIQRQACIAMACTPEVSGKAAWGGWRHPLCQHATPFDLYHYFASTLCWREGCFEELFTSTFVFWNGQTISLHCAEPLQHDCGATLSWGGSSHLHWFAGGNHLHHSTLCLSCPLCCSTWWKEERQEECLANHSSSQRRTTALKD